MILNIYKYIFYVLSIKEKKMNKLFRSIYINVKYN